MASRDVGGASAVLEEVSRGFLLSDSSVEASVRGNPYSIRTWFAYLEYKRRASLVERRFLYERALLCVPRSYKLWRAYLGELEGSVVSSRWVRSGRSAAVKRTYERCLIHLNKMPRLWIEYLRVLRRRREVTATREGFDRAFRALPLSQHALLWPDFLAHAVDLGEPHGSAAYGRYVSFDPNGREAFADYLFSIKGGGRKLREAIALLAACVEDPSFTSPSGRSNRRSWTRLCDECAKHPEEAASVLDVDAVIRSGLARFTDEVGSLWCKLADFYVRSGRFEEARDVYEEAASTVVTVRDFGVVFDKYAKFEESVLAAKMRLAVEDEDEEEDVDLRLARLEDLLERRPALLSSVVLRQNPHNVHEWLLRAQLFEETAPAKVVETYSDAVKTVDPAKATGGRPSALWLALAKFYADRGTFEANSRVVLQEAVKQPFTAVDDLTAVYCWWIEREVKAGHYDRALAVARNALHASLLSNSNSNSSSVRRPPKAASAKRPAKKQRTESSSSSTTVQERAASRSTKLWGLYLDLEESLGTTSQCEAAYDKAMDLKVATPQMVLNYAATLREREYFEKSFAVFERGVALFAPAFVPELWLAYARSFAERFEGTKVERAREIFEEALARCDESPNKGGASSSSRKKAPGYVAPADKAAFYLDYAKFEERHGLARRAVAVYERAARNLGTLEAWLLYAKKVERAYGAATSRRVFEEALPTLTSDDARAVCVKFAKVEAALGEVDRARAVYAHGSQFAEPSRHPDYWDLWKEFEVAHGNEDTFRDMLRIKRSVQTALNVAQHFVAATQADLATAPGGNVAPDDDERDDASLPPPEEEEKKGVVPGGIAALEREAASREEKAAGEEQLDAGASQPRAAAPRDPNEIDIDDDDDDVGEGDIRRDDDADLRQRPVPAGVFGSVGEEHAAALQKIATT